MEKHIALLKRLSDTNSEKNFIREEIRKKEAGSRGEDRLMVKLREMRLTGDFHILHDVSLQLDSWKVQIDCLIITDRCCIILESKNMSGELHFDSNTEEFYRLDNDNLEQPFPNPYFQLMNHIRFMKEFLHPSFPQLKITGAIVMTSKSCRIRNKPSHYPIYKIESIIEKVIHLYNSSSLSLSKKELDSIKQMIIKKQRAFTYPPLCKYYNISPQQILPGVECPSCGVLGMERISTTWTCLACGKNHRYAHITAVNEYLWLINHKITNKEFRKFCLLNSKFSASRMLCSLDFLQAHNSGRGRYYTRKNNE